MRQTNMKLKLPDGSWNVDLFLDRSEPGFDDNVFLRITEECPEQWKVFKGSQVTIGITAADARRLARLLDDVAAQEEAAAREEAGQPPVNAPRPHLRAKPAASGQRFTKIHGRYLAFIHRYQQRFLQSPAEADIQRHFLVSGPTVHSMIQRLERNGLIARTPGQARSIRLLVPPDQLPSPD